MKGQPPLKVVIIGPESTGKSSLCDALASRYDTLWCPEYARSYLEEKSIKGHNYTKKDLLEIAKGQLKQEDDFMSLATKKRLPYLFIDTDMYVMQVWSEVAFMDCHHWILEQIANRTYDFYLLCDTDLPWTADPLREYPEQQMRQKLFKNYLDLLSAQTIAFGIVSGMGEQRIKNAISLLDKYFKNSQ